MKLLPDETLLIGQWVKANGKMVADEVCQRIHALTQELKEIATTDSGWTKLYLDPSDGRFWEFSYPHSDWHGGGPPTLTYISQRDAEIKYAL